MKQLTEEAKEAKRQYYRAYRAAHPDKVKEANRRYWEKRAAKGKEAQHEKKAE